MTDIQPFSSGASPFDAIRRVRPDGSEYWSARELMPLLGYEQWRRFDEAIDRAVASCRNASVYAGDHFLQVVQRVGAGNLGDQGRNDYSLSRFACYLTAMNGDPRKPEIAAAQAYFAVKTREAETREAIEIPRSFAEALELAAKQARELEQAEQRAEVAEHRVLELVPKAEAHDAFLTAPMSDRTVGQVAKLLDWRECDLRGFLLDEKLIFVRKRPCDGRREYNYMATNKAHFTQVETRVHHEDLSHNHFTLYVTPRGIDLIRKRIADQRAKQQMAIEGAAL